jgi:Uma2 family endonuclease
MQLADLDVNKVYTYADYYSWKFEERVELIKGKIFKMSPAPSSRHQQLAGRIHTLLDYFLIDKSCEAYIAPFDVRFPRKSKKDEEITTVLQPDVCVICDRSKIQRKGCLGAPDIVVEVLSPSNSKKELKLKYQIYEESGVKEYWIVFPQNKLLIVYVLENGHFQASRPLTKVDMVTTPVLPGFELELSKVFTY